jgi:hypothetical protein
MRDTTYPEHHEGHHVSDQRRQLLGRPKLGLLVLAAAASFAAGACFAGFDANGLPCNTNAQCGPGGVCLEGFCGGVFVCDDGSSIGGDEVCNGLSDCPDGDDEDPEFCEGLAEGGDGDGDGGDVFQCDDGGQIPLDSLCDGTADCDDASDESGFCGGLGMNECSADNPDLAYELGPSVPGVVAPLTVEVDDFMGSPGPDALFAGAGGTVLNIALDLDGTAMNFPVNGMPSFEGREIVDYELGHVNGDMAMDFVAATSGDSIAIYVFQSMRPDPPELFGTAIELPDILKVLDPQLNGIELGRLNNDSSTDLVALVDAGDTNGRLVVGLGDSSAAADGGAYFSLTELPTTTLDYVEFKDSELVDLDNNGYDDLVVTGFDGTTGKMWVVGRNGDDLMAWADPVTSVAPLGEIAVGNLANSPSPGSPLGPFPDLAILDSNMNLLVPVRNQNGNMVPMTPIDVDGSQPSGLVITDLNCDGNGDFVFNVANPPQIQVLFGDGEGSVLSDTPLSYSSDGTPSGGLGVGSLGGGGAPDIFSAVDMGPNVSTPEVRVLLDL